MGWCGGTDIFDKVAAAVLNKRLSLTDLERKTILYETIDVLDGHDWDCHSDSRYWENPIVQQALRALHPDWEWDE